MGNGRQTSGMQGPEEAGDGCAHTLQPPVGFSKSVQWLRDFRPRKETAERLASLPPRSDPHTLTRNLAVGWGHWGPQDRAQFLLLQADSTSTLGNL